MKTRNQIYKGEGEFFLRMITTYHTLRYEQVMQLFPKNRESMKSFITSLLKQKRIYYNKEKDLLCDTEESVASPDYGMIAAVWVLLDFKKAVVYHTSSDFPVKLNFFANDEMYEVIYAVPGQEAVLTHALAAMNETESSRLVILESVEQASLLSIDRVVAYCTVDTDGSVSYYQKKEALAI